jgi:hypothetical protein
VDDNVDISYGVVKGIRSGKVSGDGHGEQVSVLFARCLHLIGLGLGPCRPGDFDPAFKEEVYDVSTHITCSTCDEDMAKRVFIKIYPVRGGKRTHRGSGDIMCVGVEVEMALSTS